MCDVHGFFYTNLSSDPVERSLMVGIPVVLKRVHGIVYDARFLRHEHLRARRILFLEGVLLDIGLIEALLKV